MRLSSLLGRGRGSDRIPVPERFVLDGTLYAVGDVHGKLTLLKGLVERIVRDMTNGRTRGPKTLVFLGDYVDRGEDSRGVLAYLSTLDLPECRLVFLRGNHEQQMCSFIDRPVEKRRWLDWGGQETLESFGVDRVLPGADDETLIESAARLAESMGDLRQFVDQRTQNWFRAGNVVLSHGGMNPDKALDDQSEKSMLWGNPDFMERGGPPGYWYVHGHVIHEKPAIIGNRIAVDTGAYETGILSVARITQNGCAFLQHS